MKSSLPKVLHPVAGEPMIISILKSVKRAGCRESRIVVGTGAALVKQVVEPQGGMCFEQKEQLGTADAVRSAKPENLEGDVIILNGDHPLLTSDDIKNFVAEFRGSNWDIGLVTTALKNPSAFGRIVRHKGEIKAIVEAKDASAETLKIREVNTGIYILNAATLNQYLPQIKNQNSKKEFYITDLISLCIENGGTIGGIRGKRHVAFGVNTQMELAGAVRLAFLRKAKELMENGVTVISPQNTFIEPAVTVGASTVIYPNVYLRGETQIGEMCIVEPNSVLTDTKVENQVQIKAGTYCDKVTIKAAAIVGPYARLRPGTEIGEGAHVGNFVEMKNTVFGNGAKAGHLTYLGDAEIGAETNIGCGTITCNYAVDRKKYKTKIGKNVFVGSDSQFVAPVEVGDGAVIASGSTITKNVPANALGVARGKQYNKEGYNK